MRVNWWHVTVFLLNCTLFHVLLWLCLLFRYSSQLARPSTLDQLIVRSSCIVRVDFVASTEAQWPHCCEVSFVVSWCSVLQWCHVDADWKPFNISDLEPPVYLLETCLVLEQVTQISQLVREIQLLFETQLVLEVSWMHSEV